MNRLKRLLGAEDGWGGATGTLLLIGFGVFVLFVSIADLREAARIKPEERTCASWLEDPSGARWVTLTGCKLDLSEAASRRWKGWRSVKDGGVSGAKYLELFIPVYAGLTVDDGPPRGVLATTDKALLNLIDGIDALPPEQVAAYLQAHAAEFQAILEPATLTGYVEPMKSLAARSALNVLEDSSAVVLEQGREPARANAVFGLLVGLFCVALGVRSVGRRWLLDRDSSL
jgi:hypothetical protein